MVQDLPYVFPDLDYCNTMCSNFASEKMKKSNQYYIHKRGASPDSIYFQQYAGKKSEVATLGVLQDRFGYPLSVEVDFEVRCGCNKGWVVDFRRIYDYPPIHVKSCTLRSVIYNGKLSWTFGLKDKKGNGGRDPLFDLPEDADDMIAGVYIEEGRSGIAVVKCLVRWNAVRHMMEDPTHEEFIGHKLILDYKRVKEESLLREGLLCA